MRLEDDWGDYLSHSDHYNQALELSKTYVAVKDNIICGFIRVKDDFGFSVFIHDLLVHRDYRGQKIGKQLIDHVGSHHQGTVYVMSDTDAYYNKVGINEIAGRILIVKE
jgi:GNAT superfamily N-acetyltransferase